MGLWSDHKTRARFKLSFRWSFWCKVGVINKHYALTCSDRAASGLYFECTELANIIEVQSRRASIQIRVAIDALKLYIVWVITKSDLHNKPFGQRRAILVSTGNILHCTLVFEYSFITYRPFYTRTSYY